MYYNYCFPLANEEVLNKDNLVDNTDALEEGGFASNDCRNRLGSQLRIRNDDTGLVEARKKMGEEEEERRRRLLGK